MTTQKNVGLTPEQITHRATGIGASEVAAIAGLGRWSTALDVWARKRRGPKLELPPLAADVPEPDTPEHIIPSTEVGHLAEEFLVAGWKHRRQNAVSGVPHVVPTLRDSLRAHHRATPDRLVYEGEPPTRLRPHEAHGEPQDAASWAVGAVLGVECKMIGERMLEDWKDGVPEYVIIQVQWGMHVTGVEQWDVVAWMGGSAIRVDRVVRDDALIDDLVELVDAFWAENVLGNVPPDHENAADLRRHIDRAWSIDDGQKVSAPAAAWPLARELTNVDAQMKALAGHKEDLVAKLAMMTGPHKAIADSKWGSFHYGSRRGIVDWKALAENLYGGSLPETLVEQYRGKASRTPRFYPSKQIKAGVESNLRQTRELLKLIAHKESIDDRAFEQLSTLLAPYLLVDGDSHREP